MAPWNAPPTGIYQAPLTQPPEPAPPTRPSSGQEMYTAALGLFETGQFSDFVVHSGQHSWKVHKNILASRCTFFNAVCGGGFKESAEGEVRLDEDDPDMIKGMLFYLYTFHYPESIDGQTVRFHQREIHEDELYHCNLLDGKVFGTKKWWLRHVLMYKLADKYSLPQLKATARNMIFMQLDLELENMEGWHQLLEELYQMSREDEQELREGAIRKVAEMPRSMIEEHDELKNMRGATPSYARDVIQYLMKSLQISEDKVAAFETDRDCDRHGYQDGGDGWGHVPC